MEQKILDQIDFQTKLHLDIVDDVNELHQLRTIYHVPLLNYE